MSIGRQVTRRARAKERTESHMLFWLRKQRRDIDDLGHGEIRCISPSAHHHLVFGVVWVFLYVRLVYSKGLYCLGAE